MQFSSFFGKVTLKEGRFHKARGAVARSKLKDFKQGSIHEQPFIKEKQQGGLRSKIR